LGRTPRRGLRKKSFNPGYLSTLPRNVDSEYLDKILENEATRRLREAPVAAAAIPGERAADAERLQAIKMRQEQAEKKRLARIQRQKKKRL
jgi:hypothetical protein